MEKMLKTVLGGFDTIESDIRDFFERTRVMIAGAAARLGGFLTAFLHHPHPNVMEQVRMENTEDFLFIHSSRSAKRHFQPETISLAIALAATAFIVLWLPYAVWSVSPLVTISAGIALFYFLHMSFKLWVVSHAIEQNVITITKEEIAALRDHELPVYTLLIPLYREENVITQIIAAMSAIDYPSDKLDIIITLEEYDRETIDAIDCASPPAHFKALVLPNVTPKTKPKALNVALRQSKGEFLVIYDAEIIPDPDQLKKAVITFAKHPEIATLQPRLDHYNTEKNILTRLFNAEFSFYYDFFVPGLQALNYPIPLSGHSTHFRKAVIVEAGGWDPYNVTEDCELGMRLARRGEKTAILDSMSREEATPTLTGWIKQRSRWMKGFLQTSIVHLRYPVETLREVGGWKNFFAFLLIVPGTPIVNILNMICWIALVLWLIFAPDFIQTMFPTPILYLSVTTFVLGNIIFTYLNLIGIYRRERHAVVKYGLLSPIYWVLLAAATVRAAWQLVTSPHHWEKTNHGSHLVR